MSTDQIPFLVGFSWAVTQLVKGFLPEVDPRVLAFVFGTILATAVFLIPAFAPFFAFVGSVGLAVLAASALHNVGQISGGPDGPSAPPTPPAA